MPSRLRKNKTNTVLASLFASLFWGSYTEISFSAPILEPFHISCISEDSASKAKLTEYQGDDRAKQARAWFSQWLFGNNSDVVKSSVDIIWEPVTDKGPKAKIVTNEKPHNLIHVRSKTKNSASTTSSASSPMTTESWTFSLNFNLETMIATRVQSNMSGIRGEVFAYDCIFENMTPTIKSDDADPIG